MMSTAKRKALDALLGDSVEREEARAVADWQAKVRAVRDIEEQQAAELAELSVAESAALGEVEKLRPQWDAVNRRYGFARRKRESRRYDLSDKRYCALMDAENAAPEVFRHLLGDLADKHAALCRLPSNERKVATGRVNTKGFPEYKLHSDYPAISARLQRLRSLRERVEAMRSEVVDDLPAALAKVRDEAEKIMNQ